MTTITEDYVSFETAKLLKEKGFTGDEIHKYYDISDEKPILYSESYIHEFDKDFWMKDLIMAPTLQMAMKWLRLKHNLHIMTNCIGKVNYDPIVQRFDGEDFEIEGVVFGTTKKINGKPVNVRRGFAKNEDACEEAIKYCLEHLI